MKISLIFKVFLTAMAATAAIPAQDPVIYNKVGIYYTDGTIIDEDGEEWGYTDDTGAIADDTAVWVTYNSQGTESRYDDIITVVEVIE